MAKSEPVTAMRKFLRDYFWGALACLLCVAGWVVLFTKAYQQEQALRQRAEQCTAART